jgi:hypothetical protein
MIDTLLQNPAFLILALIVALVVIATNTLFAVSIMRGNKDKIDEVFNRDKKAMDELRQRVETLEKKEHS